jgi:hypothetical protein
MVFFLHGLKWDENFFLFGISLDMEKVNFPMDTYSVPHGITSLKPIHLIE